jgi:integrase/recombinase XerD
MTARSGPGRDRELLMNSYRVYLAGERGLAEGTIVNYLHCAGVFLAELGDPLDVVLRDLTAGQVLAFFQRLQAGTGPSPRSMAGPLRSLLRFLLVRGHLSRPIAEAVPPVARWRLASLPVRMDAASVTALLAVFDRAAELGARNYAIVLLLARLGLRAGEAAGLTLNDVNWRAGTITIRGKGDRRDELPLVWDAGEAIAAYLRVRPTGGPCRALFVTAVPPRHGLTRQAIADVVRRGCVRAGGPAAGPHRLRHALASDLLAAGAGYGEVSQVLRHRDLRTTAIYAKADPAALVVLVRPWPGTQPGSAT